VQKKIQDLTLKEVEAICKKQRCDCCNCPLHRRERTSFGVVRRCVVGDGLFKYTPEDWHISKYRTEVEVE